MRSAARRARSARSGDWSIRSARSSMQRGVDLGRAASALRWRRSSTWSSYRRRPVRRPPSWLNTDHRRRQGDRHQHVRAVLVIANRTEAHDDRGQDRGHRHLRLLGPPSGCGRARRTARIVDLHRLVRRAPERDLAELVALGVGRAAEDPQRDGGGAELDDVVAGHERGLVDRAAVHRQRVGGVRVRDHLHGEVGGTGDREVVGRHGRVVEVDGAVGAATRPRASLARARTSVRPRARPSRHS